MTRSAHEGINDKQRDAAVPDDYKTTHYLPSLGTAVSAATNQERYCCPEGDRAVRPSTGVLRGKPLPPSSHRINLEQLPCRHGSLSSPSHCVPLLSRLHLAVIYILIVVRPDDCRFLPRSKLQFRKCSGAEAMKKRRNPVADSGALRERDRCNVTEVRLIIREEDGDLKFQCDRF